MKIPVLATGLSGLVGTRIREILADRFDFADISLATGVDITNKVDLEKAFNESPADVVLHMAAKTDVDGCEDDKLYGEEGAAWQINVIGSQNVAECARNSGKRVIYISTDFVFDGTKDGYTESDEPNPISWYGYTKFLGEETFTGSDLSSTILRISYPYRNKEGVRPDFVHRMIDVMRQKNKVFGLTDHIFTPTLVDDIAAGLAVFLEKDLPGIYHLVGSGSLPIIEGINLIARTFGLKPEIIPVTREIYFKDRAFRPFKLALKNDKIKKLNISMRTFEEGLKIIKQQDS